MALGLDDLRELLESFLGNSGGRRGRDRERTRQDTDAESAQAAAAAVDDAGGGDPGTAEAAPADEPTDSAGPAGGGRRQERPDPDELDEDEVVDDLYHRIEGLEDELETNGAQLGTIQDSQEQVAERVENVDDTIRQLLGVYDRLTDDVNPFTGDGEAESGFGVFGDEPADDGGFGGLSDPDNAEETVSFEDLKSVVEGAAAAQDDAQAADDAAGQKITFDEEAYIEGEADDDTHVEVQATERVEADEDEDADDVTLHELAPTYASDVIVFEWLADLVRTAGPAATLRAISYYHEIGWIDADVKAHLERVLSGPDLDIHVDPSATPDELTAEDHADSYTYIMKLDEIHETRTEVESSSDR